MVLAQPQRDHRDPAGRRLPGRLHHPDGLGRPTFRTGDRWGNPLDQWPDPEVYIHYPSGQHLAYVDIRNVNRAGRPRQRHADREDRFAFMEMIKRRRSTSSSTCTRPSCSTPSSAPS